MQTPHVYAEKSEAKTGGRIEGGGKSGLVPPRAEEMTSISAVRTTPELE